MNQVIRHKEMSRLPLAMAEKKALDFALVAQQNHYCLALTFEVWWYWSYVLRMCNRLAHLNPQLMYRHHLMPTVETHWANRSHRYNCFLSKGPCVFVRKLHSK